MIYEWKFFVLVGVEGNIIIVKGEVEIFKNSLSLVIGSIFSDGLVYAD